MTKSRFNFNLSGYCFMEELYSDSRTVVYRAMPTGLEIDENPHSVVVKLLLAVYPTPQELLNFRYQYIIAKNLNIPGIVRPYSLEEYHALDEHLAPRGYALVMEDFGGVSLDWYYQNNFLAIDDVLEIAIQLADILHALGQQRTIHKDIKPANILIHPVTKQVKLIDFSIASLLPSETPAMLSPHLLEGTLAYLSPEQTGRMNRVIDYRSDFYALGITLYELLTGKLPFEATEPIDLIYCHLAQLAVAVEQINPAVPVVVAQLVAKLMAKNAEDRYQSALGLKYDLEQCLAQCFSTGGTGRFELGQRDRCSRFMIPEKLYGRDTEVQTILAAFDRACQGSGEMLLVAGLSGIGKTAVINEVHKPIARQHGYFVKGKFDQFNRNLPLSAVVQALRDLIKQLLSESAAQLALWQSQILTAVGTNGAVVLAVIPELEQIIGSQPAVADLTGTAAQNRFNLTFQKFMAVFATATHPLVMFLDDLQWADGASLQLIKLLMLGRGHLLLLGAYRDNEVSAVHPLLLMVAELNPVVITIQTITLAPFTSHDIDQLVADTLHCSIEQAQPLTAFIIRKTKGNPFFTTQFLKVLHAEGDIRFHPDGYWECDLGAVQARSTADDVVTFMASQLQKLPAATQEILKLATCIGNQFGLATLAIVAEQSPTSVATALWPLLQAGWILPNSPIYKFFQSDAIAPTPSVPNIDVTYRFLHDRVQQAAYALMPECHKQQTHLQIGRLLLANVPAPQQSEKLFEIVNHLNMALMVIDQPAERDLLAGLNLRAAQKARAANAYAAAYDYARIGTDILGAAGWTQQYQLTLALHDNLADAAFLAGEFTSIPQIFQTVLERAQSPIDRVKSYETILQFHTLHKQYPQAINRGLEILHQLGIKLSLQPSKFLLLQELAKTKLALSGKSDESLLRLPAIIDYIPLARLQILELLMIPAFFCSQELMLVLATKGIQLTLKSGNSPWAASFYGTYGMILSTLGDLKQSYRLGQLALTLVDRFDNLAITAQIKATVPWFTQPWQQDLRSSIAVVDESITAAIDSGNPTFLGIGAYIAMIMRFYAGVSLDELAIKMQELEQLITQSKDESSYQLFQIYLQATIELRSSDGCLDKSIEISHEEMSSIFQWQKHGEAAILSAIYSIKTFLAYIFGDIPAALNYADLQLPYISTKTGIAMAGIYDPLTRLAVYPSSNKKLQQKLLERVNQTQCQLAKRAKLMPGNFQHKYDLVAAEKCRVLGDFTTAIELYDLAITGAKKNEFVQEEALANELAAKFYLAWGKEKIAATYLQEAYYCYLRWGAMAKTNDLEQRYPQLLAPILKQCWPEFNPLSTLARVTHAAISDITTKPEISTFDLVAILQSVQVLSSIMELPDLINQFCQILLKNSGATTCIPILLHPDQTTNRDLWQVYSVDTTSIASTFIQTEQVLKLNCSPLSEYHFLPLQLIEQVRRDGQTIILDGLASSDFDRSIVPNSLRFTDPYLQRYQPQSAMCLPLLLRGELRGMVYLENRHTADVFTSDRQIVLDFLASQVVSTLYNAQLYESVALRSAALETSVDGIAIVENDRFLDINQSKAYMYGYTVAELLPLSWQCLYAPDQIAYFQTHVFPVLSLRGQWRGEVIATRKDGSNFDEEVTLSLLANGQIICISRDITDRKQAAEQLHQTNQRLELTNEELHRATRLKDEFLATMSHELRTPLNAILGMSEVLQEELFGSLNAQQLNSITTIEQSGEHLLSLINDILDVSKISAGKLELNITKVSLTELCKSSLMFIKQQAFEKQIQLHTQLPIDLESVFVDERRLRQVLINLLNNAVKFTNQGGVVTLSVSVRAELLTDHPTADCGLRFSISDTGIGISRDDLPKLFQPFIQLDSNLNRKYNGTGLGLMLVKQLVELHGGSVTIDSTVGEGSCFTVLLPQPDLVMSATDLIPSSNAIDSSVLVKAVPDRLASAIPRAQRILLVEDNAVNINTFSSYLNAKGYQLILAYNGREALTLTASELPDLILMDIQMPDMDGLVAIDRLRQQPQYDQIPIIALTALATAGDRDKCLAVGANRYLTKPVKLRELHQTIQECLDVR
jgi:PAS domain S-box-containing protein